MNMQVDLTDLTSIYFFFYPEFLVEKFNVKDYDLSSVYNVIKNLGYCIFVTNGICQTFKILLMYPFKMKAVLTE